MIGLGVFDFVIKDQYDPQTGETYRAFTCCNDKVMASRCKISNANACLWSIKANASFNNEMCILLRSGFQNKRINLLVHEFEGEEIVRKKVKGYTKMDTRYQAMLKVPYIQTSLLINELVNLDHKVNNGNIQIMEKSGMRKDRYSSLGYNYWVLQQIIRTEIINKIDALYNYQQYKQENITLKQQTFRQKSLLFSIILSLLFLLSIGIVFWQKHKRKEQNILLQQEKLKRLQEEQYQYSQTQIEENNKKINNLSILLQDAKQTNDKLRQNLLQAQKELIEKTNIQLKAAQAIKESSWINLQQTNVWKKLHQPIEKNEIIKMTDTDWMELTKSIEEIYPNFIQRLNELSHLSKKELQVCLLIKINISLTHIANIVCSSKQGISSLRERLYKKFVGKKGKPKDCDNFIRNL